MLFHWIFRLQERAWDFRHQLLLRWQRSGAPASVLVTSLSPAVPTLRRATDRPMAMGTEEGSIGLTKVLPNVVQWRSSGRILTMVRCCGGAWLWRSGSTKGVGQLDEKSPAGPRSSLEVWIAFIAGFPRSTIANRYITRPQLAGISGHSC